MTAPTYTIAVRTISQGMTLRKRLAPLSTEDSSRRVRIMILALRSAYRYAWESEQSDNYYPEAPVFFFFLPVDFFVAGVSLEAVFLVFFVVFFLVVDFLVSPAAFPAR